MHWTLPPLLGRVDKFTLFLRDTGNAALDLRPVKGATMLVWAGEDRAIVAAEETIMEEAIVRWKLSLVERNRNPTLIYK